MSIKIENVVLPSPEQWERIIYGMRNPLLSYNRIDSGVCDRETYGNCNGCNICDGEATDGHFVIGPNDLDLMMRLCNAGSEHRKFMRMLPVMLDITAPLYWWKEFDTYKVGTVANSCSTMHKIHAKEFTLEDFSCEHLDDSNKYPFAQVSSLDCLKETINVLNGFRDAYIQYDTSPFKEKSVSKKDIWWQMIQLLPSSYNQKRTVMLNYEVLAAMYHQRKAHKLDCWVLFCDWIETIPYAELITGDDGMYLSPLHDPKFKERKF